MPEQLPSWVIYASMPVVGAVIGYLTKLVAVEMMFRPVRFVGIPPVLGWQGVIPRFAPRMAAVAVDLMLARLLTARELFDRIDARDLTARLNDPMRRAIEEIVREVMAHHQPLLWEAMPETARKSLIWAVQRQAPKVVTRLVSELKTDPDRVLDLRRVAVDALTRDARLLVTLVRRVGRHELRFIVKVGAPFGAFLGAVQALAWALTHNEWVVPTFGAFTGYFTDWLALQMIFRPVTPHRYLGIRWQGLFHRRRERVINDYAELIGTEILSPANLIEAVLTGPQSDRLVTFITREVDAALGARVGPARPLLVLAVGGRRYQDMRAHIVAAALDRIRGSLDEIGDHALHALDIRGTLVTKMATMTDDEYEGLLRPAFKQDEWKLVSVGAVLGFLIGELQVLLLLH